MLFIILINYINYIDECIFCLLGKGSSNMIARGEASVETGDEFTNNMTWDRIIYGNLLSDSDHFEIVQMCLQ